MGGVFGVVDTLGRPCSAQTQKMAESLRLCEWTRTQVWSDDQIGVGLGQVNIGLFSSNGQPLRSRDEALAIAFFGELYYTQSLRRQLTAEGYSLDSGTDAELILRAYQSKGGDFIHNLEGVFVLAVWDGKRERLLVINDRFGLIPTYYAYYDGRLAFAPKVKGILADADLDRKLDLTSMAQFLRFQRLLGDRTFFQGLRLLPYGSVLEFDRANNALNVSHYWDFDQIPGWCTGATFDDAVIEVGRLLRQAVDTRIQGEHRVGAYLSGGLDSRTLLGLASQIRPPIVSLSYGVPDCRDARYGGSIARRVGSPHHFVPLNDGHWVRDEVDFHLEATEGFTTWTHSHAATTLQPARELMEVNLTGFGGDQVLGGRGICYAPLLHHAPDEIAFGCQAFEYLNQGFSWPGITEAEERALYIPAIYAEVAGRAWDSLQEELETFKGASYPRRWDFFTTIYQGTRLSNLNVVYQRAFFEARYPFCDYALVDFVYSMPIEDRLQDKLYLAVINREIPEVTWVPRDTDGRLLTRHRLIREAHGLWQEARRHITGERPNIIHEDPEGWLRRDLRDWAKELLLSARTLDRGVFNPAFLRSIFDRHMSGHEQHTIGKIAPIMTYEMMLRRYYD